ncbi:hypothetical protein [Streptomyces sp. NPDC058657]|uniref:hypothetical protein n=1 Tax=unclassified Streptomyces TaxID=2593676 RepID=UPI003662CD6D
MDPQIAALAGTAGTTLVTLMATDAWQRTRDGVTALWRRVHPERADAVAGELDHTREQLLVAREGGDTETEGELRADWQGRVRRLLRDDPGIVADLRALLDELAPEAAKESGSTHVEMHGHATGNGQVFQAGRDQTVNKA